MCFDKSREEEKKTAITFTENPEIFVSLAGKKIENSAVQRNCEIKTNRRRMKRIENGLKWTSLSRKKKLRKILERHWEFMIISNVFFSVCFRQPYVPYFKCDLFLFYSKGTMIATHQIHHFSNCIHFNQPSNNLIQIWWTNYKKKQNLFWSRGK